MITILRPFLPAAAGGSFSFTVDLPLALPAGDLTAADPFLAFFLRAVDFAINSQAARSFDGEVGGDLPIANSLSNQQANDSWLPNSVVNSSSAAFEIV